MALLAETLVEEWLNRRGYFTVRGVKEGVSEMDLLAVKPLNGSEVEALHVEVQTSFRPINYLSPLTKELAASLRKPKGAAISRTPEMLKECVEAWIEKKYDIPRKRKRREALWAGLDWEYVLVHAVVKHPEELAEIAQHGVRLVPLEDVLQDLCPPQRPSFTASAGGDLADLIDFYGRTHRLPLPDESEDEDQIEDEGEIS